MPRFSNLTRSTTLRVAGAVAALAVAVPVTGTSAAEKQVVRLSCGTDVAGVAVWQSLRAPTFSRPDGIVVKQEITSFAVEPKPKAGRLNTVLVTNGNSIWRSTAGGCGWRDTLVLGQAPHPDLRLSGITTTIVGLYISPGGTAYALAEEGGTASTPGRPHVLVSDDGGESWTLGDAGLPPVGRPLNMRASTDEPNVMYLSFSQAPKESGGGIACPPAPLPCPPGPQQPQRSGLLYRSTDGGQTWSLRTSPSGLEGLTEIKYFSIDHDDSTGNTIWVAAGNPARTGEPRDNYRLLRSVNGGQTFTTPPGLPEEDQEKFDFSAVETIEPNDIKQNPLKVVAFSADGRMIRYDANRKWLRSTIPFGAVQSVAQRPEGDIAVTTFGPNVGVWRIYPRDFDDYTGKNQTRRGKRYANTKGWEPLNPGTPIDAPGTITGGDSGSSAQAGTYYVRDNDRLLRFLRPVQVGPTDPITGGDVAPPEPPRGKILPTDVPITIPIGKTMDVDYRLTLPPAPTPLDLYLLIDNSGSMEYLIRDLKKNLERVARALVAAGVDVQVGVGRINVQPDTSQPPPVDDPTTPDVDEGAARPLYERLRRIGRVDSQLFRELDKIDGYGGSGDEAQLESLWTAVTGKGQSAAGLGPLIGYQIKPDQGAEFREGIDSIKVILHATDEPFSENIRNGRSFDETAKALSNAGVLQIGLSNDPSMGRSADPDKPTAHGDLVAMAVETGALAPEGGVSCDDDPAPEIQENGALVCGESEGLDKTLLNILASISDKAEVTLSVPKGPTVVSVDRTTLPIDAKEDIDETFRIRYTCVDVPEGIYDNTIQASLRGMSIAVATQPVNCGGVDPPGVRPAGRANVPGAQPGEPGSNPQPLTQLNAPVPVPAPVQPITQPQVQTQTQAQSQANPQAGAADQEQEQIQVATATNTLAGGRQEDEQLAMSGLDYSRTAQAPYYVLLTGVGMALGTGVALRRRLRTQLARQRIR